MHITNFQYENDKSLKQETFMLCFDLEKTLMEQRMNDSTSYSEANSCNGGQNCTVADCTSCSDAANSGGTSQFGESYK